MGHNGRNKTDIGDWIMELTNIEGTIYKFPSSLCSDFDYEGTDLSEILKSSDFLL